MRLLFDEQLSNRLPHLLADCYPDSAKVVWLRLGNCTTQDIVDLLRKHAEDIRQFAAQDEAAFLELGGRRMD